MSTHSTDVPMRLSSLFGVWVGQSSTSLPSCWTSQIFLPGEMTQSFCIWARDLLECIAASALGP